MINLLRPKFSSSPSTVTIAISSATPNCWWASRHRRKGRPPRWKHGEISDLIKTQRHQERQNYRRTSSGRRRVVHRCSRRRRHPRSPAHLRGRYCPHHHHQQAHRLGRKLKSSCADSPSKTQPHRKPAEVVSSALKTSSDEEKADYANIKEKLYRPRATSRRAPVAAPSSCP